MCSSKKKCNRKQYKLCVKEAGNGCGASTVVGGKIRRRTCYECGEKGHLASDYPKKQVADLDLIALEMH